MILLIPLIGIFFIGFIFASIFFRALAFICGLMGTLCVLLLFFAMALH